MAEDEGRFGTFEREAEGYNVHAELAKAKATITRLWVALALLAMFALMMWVALGQDSDEERPADAPPPSCFNRPDLC